MTDFRKARELIDRLARLQSELEATKAQLDEALGQPRAGIPQRIRATRKSPGKTVTAPTADELRNALADGRVYSTADVAKKWPEIGRSDLGRRLRRLSGVKAIGDGKFQIKKP
jgi:hypothetical protein